MKLPHCHRLLSVILCSSLAAAQSQASKQGTSSKQTSSSDAIKSALSVDALETAPEARVVRYGDKDVVKIRAKLRYTTLIVLPKNEQILDFTCGDKEFWIVSGVQNFAYVKPAKAGTETNLNLITASGNVYSFVFVEVSEIPKALPDLKVFIELQEGAMSAAVASAPTFVPARVADDLRREAEMAKEETNQVKQSAQTAIDTGIAKFLANVRFPYRFEAGKKPFFVRAIYNDDKFTYIQARPEETPTLYEVKDGKPNLVNFDYKDGVYVVGKILDEGYLAIGKQKLSFVKQE